jgi:hypothetical protein
MRACVPLQRWPIVPGIAVHRLPVTCETTPLLHHENFTASLENAADSAVGLASMSSLRSGVSVMQMDLGFLLATPALTFCSSEAET